MSVKKKDNYYCEPRVGVTLDIINKFATRGSIVLEIGATDASFKGDTLFSKWITVDKYGQPDFKLDLNTKMLSLPFMDNSVDLIICTEVLEHLSLGSPLLKEFSRILKSTGVAVISVPNIVSLKSRIKVLRGDLPVMAASGDCGPSLGGTGYLVDGNWVGGHVIDFNAARLKKYLLRSGLAVNKEWKVPVHVIVNERVQFTISDKLIPRTLQDFILVTARPILIK